MDGMRRTLSKFASFSCDGWFLKVRERLREKVEEIVPMEIGKGELEM